MGLSIKEQRDNIRYINKLNGNIEKAFKPSCKPKTANKIKKTKRIEWNRKMSNKLAEKQRSLKNKNELIFIKILRDCEIPYIWQKPFSCDKRFVCVDFYFKRKHVIVEIDGSSHLSKKAVKSDNQRTKYLKSKHKINDVFRVTNEQLYYNINDIKDLLIDKLY